jgi:hypothetical protein
MPTELYSNVTNLSITKQKSFPGFPRIKVKGIIVAKPDNSMKMSLLNRNRFKCEQVFG